MNWRLIATTISLCVTLSVGPAFAENCVTQSQMTSAERTALAETARSLAIDVQTNNQTAAKAATIAEFATNFTGIGNTINATAPKLAGDTAEVEQIYILDATANKADADGSLPNADFVCTLNKGNSEADFTIPGLPPGRYAFAMIKFTGPKPWMVSMLLRQDNEGAPWQLAGLFPKEISAAGHDGLWYWAQARAMATSKHPWVAYLYYQEAQRLLRPAPFVSSTHLENLRSESSSAVPPAIGDGISADTPMVVKGSDGTVYRFTSIEPNDSLHQDKLDIAAHMLLDSPATDQAAVTKTSRDAMIALLAQHPELRQDFHGMWVFAGAQGQTPIATEAAMNDIH